jgi:hypothetical protein
MEEFNLDAPPPPPPRASATGRVIAINFGIMLIYMVLTFAFSLPDKISSHGEAYDAMLIVLQTGLNLVGGLVLLFWPQLRSIARGLLLAALLVPIIGFGACVMKIQLFSS